eukprot:m.23372 g.23372  ORF g.23372 m.23372 type:complete len:342 (-) comp4107_c0_seq1:93-1118(-)
MARSVEFGSEDWATAGADILREDGVLVLHNVLPDAECEQKMESLVGHLRALNPALTRKPSTWTPGNLPSGPRSGLFQSLVSHFPTVWELRADERVRSIFTEMYSALRGRRVEDYVVSLDGINVRPPARPFHRPDEDWAHLDQTVRNDIFSCIQGQVVLSNSTACFRCSPKSHLVFEEVLDAAGCNNDRQWCLFHKSLYPELRRLIEGVGGQWQIPVEAPRGSVILWLSSVIHSARLQLPGSEVDPTDCWSQWRGVVYICYRPLEDVDEAHIGRLRKCFKENRSTNHWGTKIFPLNTRSRRDSVSPHASIARLLKDPTAVYEIRGLRPPNTPAVRALLGYLD